MEGEAEGGTGGVGEGERVKDDSEGHDGGAKQQKQFLTFRERVNLLKPALRAAGLAINPVASKSAKAVNERARAAKIIREGIIASESFQVQEKAVSDTRFVEILDTLDVAVCLHLWVDVSRFQNTPNHGY